jgi:hypothetical protein
LAATENHAGGINSKIDSEAAIKKKNAGPQGASLSDDALEDALIDKMKEGGDAKRRLPSIAKDATIANQRSRSQMKSTPQKANTVQQTPATSNESPVKGGVKDGQPMINALTNSLRMSKEVKILRALEEKEQLSANLLSKSKIDKDRKVQKEFNMGLIQAKTIEALLRFLELDVNEAPQALDQKLNQHRIQG